MRNKTLSVFATSIPYYGELRKLAGSVASTLLMQQLDFRFGIKPNGFYKFLEPCNATGYKEGDSWTEEIHFSAKEFRTAFKHIGIAYKSKKQYDQAEDKFQGKYYCSYFNKVSRQTHYFRNHKLLDHHLDLLCRGDFPVNSQWAHLETPNGHPVGITDRSPDYTNNTYKENKSNNTHIEESLEAIDSGFENSSSSSHNEEVPNHSDNGLGGSEKRKSSAKKKSSVPKPVKKLGPMDKYNDAGYVVFPTKGCYAAHGTLAMRLLHCELISTVGGLVFDYDFDDKFVWIDLGISAIAGFGIENNDKGIPCLISEDYLMKKLPLRMIQSLNNSSDNRGFDFSVNWYNERAVYWWNELIELIEQSGYSAKELIEAYRGQIFFRLLRDNVEWTTETYLGYTEAA